MNRRLHWKAVAVVAGVLLLPVAVIGYPLVHNYHVVPLARLRDRVQRGDDCAEAARALAAYFHARQARGNDDVQFTDQSTSDDHAFQNLHPPRRMLHLYDLTLFDDVQLTVLCQPDGRRVERVLYVGD
jgi:hypothetical protein